MNPLPRIEALYREYVQTHVPSVQENANILQQQWSELEWQALWYSGACGTSFRATNGALVEVVQFGFWNREPGPDFIRACIRVDGSTELQGDIEFDIRAVDWEQHRHSQNSSYDGVILHVFLHRPGARFFTQTSNHHDILQVHLKPDLLPSRLSFAPGIAKTGACAAPLRQLRPAQIDELLETAALVRIQRKAEQLQRAIRIHGIDEALFQAIAIALGYKSNKVPFLIIAQRVPLKFSRTGPIQSRRFCSAYQASWRPGISKKAAMQKPSSTSKVFGNDGGDIAANCIISSLTESIGILRPLGR